LINDGVQYDIRSNAIELGFIENYVGYPCNHDLCQNEGVCQPFINRFKCMCANGYSGEFCQINTLSTSESLLNRNKRRDQDLQNINYAIYLDGHSQLIYKNRISDL